MYICMSVYTCFKQVLLVESIYQIGLDWLLGTPLSDAGHAHSEDVLTDENFPARVSGLYLIWSVYYTHLYKPRVLVSPMYMWQSQVENEH